MAHIHTQPGQHDHTASAIIIRTDGDQPRIMLHKHKKAGVYMQFGGHIELDETPWQTITHELLEESGYEMNQLQILQPKDRIKDLLHSIIHPQPVCVNTHLITPESSINKHFHTDTIYAFVTGQEPAHQVARDESSDFILLTRQELVDLPANQTFPNVHQICLHIFDICLPTWEKVSTKEFH